MGVDARLAHDLYRRRSGEYDVQSPALRREVIRIAAVLRDDGKGPRTKEVDRAYLKLRRVVN